MTKKKKMAIILPAIIFSINFLIAISFKKYDDFTYLFGGTWNIIKSIVLCTIYTLIFGIVLKKIYDYLEKIPCGSKKIGTQWTVTWIGFVAILLCYIPYLYAYYPCSLGSDSTEQLGQFFGTVEKTNHHPYFSTLLMGLFMKTGMAFGSEELGAFLYVIMQTLVLAFAFAYTLGLMVKWELPWQFPVVSAVFYGVTPIWGGYAQLIIKDTLYTAMVVLFVAAFLDTVFESVRGTLPKHKIPLLVIFGLLSALLRNNGIYAVVPGVVGGAILFAKKKKGRCWLVGLAACVGLYFLWGSIILPALNVRDGSIREALSVPFQQTARYIRDYPDEVTEEERAAISAVLDYDQIREGYLSTVADPVKNTYKEPENETAALARYFKHWAIMFFKHPMVYVEATVANSYYYFCANEDRCMGPIYVDFIHQDNRTAFMELTLQEDQIERRVALTNYANGFRELPILRFLYSQGLYTYVLIALIGFLAYIKKIKYIVGLLPSMVGVLVCIASPVQGNIRYFLPVIACTCICVAYCVKCKQLEQENI